MARLVALLTALAPASAAAQRIASPDEILPGGALFFGADDGRNGGELGYTGQTLWRLERGAELRRGDAERET